MACQGLDCGTFNLIRCDELSTDIKKNVFLTIPPEIASKRHLKKMKIPFVEIEEQLHLLSDEAYHYANIFDNSVLRRPMARGLLNSNEVDAFPVIRHLIGTLIGSSETKETVVYSIPGRTIDMEREVDYHRDVLKEIIEFFGFHAKPLNEAMCVANAGLEDEDFTGIALSFGAGQVQVAVVFRGLSATQFSLARSGDWITENVSRDCGISWAKANMIKEKGNYSINPYSDKRKTREQNAILTYYKSLITYVLANISAQFEAADNTPTFPDPVKIVCAGGTSMPDGFIPLFKEQFTQEDFPIEIKDIELVDEPLTAIARGAFIEAKLEDEE